MSKTLVALVGNQYRGDEAVAVLQSLPNGAPLDLIREPTNSHDYWAIQVWGNDVHIGYVKGGQNQKVAEYMDAMRRARQADFRLPAKLAIDGGRWPMVEVDI